MMMMTEVGENGDNNIGNDNSVDIEGDADNDDGDEDSDSKNGDADDNDDGDENEPMVGNLLVVENGHRETLPF